MSGTSSATISWSAGTFKAGSGNLYSYTADSVYQINIDVSGLSGLKTVAMQAKQFAPLEAEWIDINHDGYQASDAWTLSLDGGAAVARDQFGFTFAEEDFPTSFGDVDLFAGVLLWEDVNLTGISTLTIDFDNPVHTSFAQVAVDIGSPQVTLTVNVVGSGTVTLDPPGGTYDEDTVVTLTATPASGWEFTAWSGDLNSANNPDTITIDSDKTVTVTFTQVGCFISSVLE
jgi:hypothetical protein